MTEPTTNEFGPIIKDTDYKSPTYNQFVANPQYKGAAVSPFDPKTGATLPPVSAPKPAPVVNAPTVSSTGATDADALAYLKSLGYSDPDALEIQGAKEELAQQLQDRLKTPEQGIVSSSDSIVSNENKLKGEINNFSTAVSGQTTPTDPNAPEKPDEAGMRAQGDKDLQFVDDYIASLKQRQIDEAANIEADYQDAKAGTEEAQKREVGTTTTGLARLGGYLGGSASQMGVLLTQASQHRSELATLKQKRDQALSEARNAISDKQFAAARERFNMARSIENDIQERKDKFFNQTLQASQEMRAQDEFTREKVKEDLSALSLLEEGKVPESKMKEIDAFYGVQGFTKQYLDVTRAAAQAKSQKDILANRKDILDMMEKIPAGQVVKFPDGTELTGMGKTSDIATYLQTDDNGVGHIISYNKATGAMSTTNVGVVGKSKVAGGIGNSLKTIPPNVQDNAKMLFQKSLEDELKQSNAKGGHYSPAKYIELRTQLKEALPAMVPVVDAIYLGKVDEAGQTGYFDRTGVKYLREHGIPVGKEAVANYQMLTGEDAEPAVVEDEEPAEEQ